MLNDDLFDSVLKKINSDSQFLARKNSAAKAAKNENHGERIKNRRLETEGNLIVRS